MGYLLAALALLNLLLGGGVFYYKEQYDSIVVFKQQVEDEARIATEYAKLLEHQSKRQLEITNEQHKLEISRVTSDLNSLRKQASKSILPTVPNSTGNEISFDREKLDQALQEFRNEIAELIGEGNYCQVDLDIINDWLDKQKVIFAN